VKAKLDTPVGLRPSAPVNLSASVDLPQTPLAAAAHPTDPNILAAIAQQGDLPGETPWLFVSKDAGKTWTTTRMPAPVVDDQKTPWIESVNISIDSQGVIHTLFPAMDEFGFDQSYVDVRSKDLGKTFEPATIISGPRIWSFSDSDSAVDSQGNTFAAFTTRTTPASGTPRS
jgi:hypothetical protein